MRKGFVIGLLAIFLALTWAGTIEAAVLFLYDFPGNPGSGLAADQTNNTQPAGATFSDFTRTGGLTQLPGASSNDTFGTQNWNQTGAIDTSQYEGFSITANLGKVLNLTSLVFDLQLKPSGPANFEVGLFLNGSSTAYATFDLTPTTTMTTYTFDFPDLVNADNTTSATFKFFGWNAGASGGGIYLDNIVTSGSIVPEPNSIYFATLPVLMVVCSLGRAIRQSRSQPPQ